LGGGGLFRSGGEKGEGNGVQSFPKGRENRDESMRGDFGGAPRGGASGRRGIRGNQGETITSP